MKHPMRLLSIAAATLALLLLTLVPVQLQATDARNAPALQASTDKDLVETAVAGGFNTLVAAVQAAGLVETLQGEGPFTVFAPTDEAFAKLPEGTVERLLRPENKDQLVALLTYHVVAGKVNASEVVQLESAPTVQGASVAISTGNGGVMINNARVTAADVEASNGIIHVIDTVLMPPAHH